MKNLIFLRLSASLAFLFIFALSSFASNQEQSGKSTSGTQNAALETNVSQPVQEPMRLFQLPKWETLQLQLTSDSRIWRLKNAEGKHVLDFYALKQEATPKLQTRLEKDCLVVSTGEMKSPEFGNVQMRIMGLPHESMAENDYCLYYEVQGPVGASGKFYFEGYTKDKKHYYQCQEVRFSGRRQKLAFDKFVHGNLSYLTLRYDFFGEGEFRLYSSAVRWQELAPSALTDEKPRLLFSANFDGTPEAQSAEGKKTPKTAKNLKFVPDGVQGQALEFRAGLGQILEYETEGNLNPEQGSISVWIKPDWSGPADKNTWRTILSQPWQFDTRIGSGAIWCWIHEGTLRFDTSDLRDKYLTSSIPKDDSWVHLVFTWNDFKKSFFVNGRECRSMSDGVNLAEPRLPFRYDRMDFDSFFVGNLREMQLEGMLDELKIYSMALSFEDVQKLYREFRPVSFGKGVTKCLLEDEPFAVSGTVKNVSSETLACRIQLENAEGKILREKSLEIPAKDEADFTLNAEPQKAGNCLLSVFYEKTAAVGASGNAGKAESGKAGVAETGTGKAGSGKAGTGETGAGKTESGKADTVSESGKREEVSDSRKIVVLEAPHSREFLKEQRTRMARESSKKSPWMDELELKLLEEIDVPSISQDRFTSFGKSEVRELKGRKYLEMENQAGARFAIHLPKLEAGKVYCFEWDIPDDKMRTVDIIAQTAKGASGGEYELQTGYCTGDEYPNSGEWITQRNIFWARSDDFALVFTSARTVTPIDKKSGVPAVSECVGGGAAVGTVRVYEVLNEELPAARIVPAKPVNGWTRQVGIYFEDPAVNFDFGANGSTDEGYAVTLDRLCQYMKFSGQHMLAYPMVWYHGPIGEKYNPRNHVPYFFEGILERFDREGLEFMGTFNQNSVSFEVPLLSRVDLTSGKLNNSVFTIHETGTPHPGGWHGTPPVFNSLHPDVQKMTLRQLDDILEYAAKHPSFKGIILHLPRHALHSLGDIRAGYNQFLVEQFEKETGIQIPVDHSAPLFGKLCFEWLMENERERWTDWRCRKIADWYRTLAEHLRKARPDLKLGINCMIPILYEPSEYDAGTERDFWEIINREMGVDGKYLADVPNLFIDQTLFPADYRWTENRKPDDIRARLRNTEETEGMYASLAPSPNAWIHHHDRYWESAIGRDSSMGLTADWLKEHPWRVSTLNPVEHYAMKHYVLPFKYKDIQGITKGGFLIGTYGMEEKLAAFSAAFRALPAVPFSDCAESTENVKVRKYSDGKKTWYYAVNVSDKPAEITIPVGTEKMVDLARNVVVKAPEKSLRIQLKPYSLRSFRTFQSVRGSEK